MNRERTKRVILFLLKAAIVLLPTVLVLGLYFEKTIWEPEVSVHDSLGSEITVHNIGFVPVLITHISNGTHVYDYAPLPKPVFVPPKQVVRIDVRGLQWKSVLKEERERTVTAPPRSEWRVAYAGMKIDRR